jgi:biotin-dependent carboxylase-like uncharacterized protein
VAINKWESRVQLEILSPGILSLIQDSGRFGQHSIGLTSGGPMDPVAFKWANRLLDNDQNASVIESTVGGLKIKSHGSTRVAITGANVSAKINGQLCKQWQSLNLALGDILELGYATSGCRIYVAVAGGFKLQHHFYSNSTVVREGVGGLNGSALAAGDKLECHEPLSLNDPYQLLAENVQPQYSDAVTLRVIPGYQQAHFSAHEKNRFYHNEFKVSELCDRMGYRLSGPRIACDIDGILSEGICLGAIQVPKDGQPIILMNDRQTIGGYPKLGSVLSLDLAKLAQLTQGGRVKFEAITIDDAHNFLVLAQHKFEQTKTEFLTQ